MSLQNKHAYLIIAHNEYPVLRTLLSMLDDERNDIYLYIDRRSRNLRKSMHHYELSRSKLHIIPNPIKLYWGDISLVEAEFTLLETASANGKYAYYHLLSGVDLPLKNQNYIHDFFDRHAGAEFVGCWETDEHRRDVRRRVGRYYLFTRHLRDKGTLAHALAAPVRNVALGLQKAVRFQRPWDYDFHKGYQWASLTQPCCDYIIKEKKNVMRRFRMTLAPDEIFLPTLVWASPFRRNIYDTADPTRGSQRLVDWERGRPYVWQEADFDELMHAPALFAPKLQTAAQFLKRRVGIPDLKLCPQSLSFPILFFPLLFGPKAEIQNHADALLEQFFPQGPHQFFHPVVAAVVELMLLRVVEIIPKQKNVPFIRGKADCSGLFLQALGQGRLSRPRQAHHQGEGRFLFHDFPSFWFVS